MSERDMPAGGGSSPYDEPTGEIDLGQGAPMRRRRVPSEERDSFYAKHAMPPRPPMSRVDDLDDIEPDELETTSMRAPDRTPATQAIPPQEKVSHTGEKPDTREGASDTGEAATEPFTASSASARSAPTTAFDAADPSDVPSTRAAYTEVHTPAVPAPAIDPDMADDHDVSPTADDRLRATEADLADMERHARRGTLDLGLLLLRCAVGVIAMAHGAQKLFGWWNGPRLSGFEDMLINAPNTAIGFQPDAARPLAIVGALSETLGGLMLVVGLFTPLAASAVLGVMLIAAAYKATLAGGVWFFVSGGGGAGIEYELLLVVCAAVIILTGPGRLSIDAPRGWARRPAWGSLALLVVGIGAAVAIWLLFNGTNPFHSPGNPT